MTDKDILRDDNPYIKRMETAKLSHELTEARREIEQLRAASEAGAVPDRVRLRQLVAVVWNEATESTAEPDTPWADRMIDKVFAAPPAPVEAGAVPRKWPPVAGVGRDAGHPKAVMVYLSTEPTDDEMRAMHDALRGAAPSDAPAQQDLECERCGEPPEAHTPTHPCGNQSFRVSAPAAQGDVQLSGNSGELTQVDKSVNLQRSQVDKSTNLQSQAAQGDERAAMPTQYDGSVEAVALLNAKGWTFGRDGNWHEPWDNDPTALSRQPSAAANEDQRACVEYFALNPSMAVLAFDRREVWMKPSAAASAPEAPHPDSGHHERYIAGWNACRAALATAKPKGGAV